MQAKLTKQGVLIKDQQRRDELAQKGYGEKTADGLLLMPEEAVFMSDKKQAFEVTDARGKKYDYEKLLKHYAASDSNFVKKYVAFRDLRSRGFCVKRGFKGESHYRVYSRGDKPQNAQAIWLVKCLTEESTFSFPQLDKEIRSAQAVRKKVMYAISDKEGDMTYYIIDKA
ncbi:tRNA-intron lyase, partial [archaeon]|nr:tRNA-intron lyase [archaeon]